MFALKTLEERYRAIKQLQNEVAEIDHSAQLFREFRRHFEDATSHLEGLRRGGRLEISPHDETAMRDYLLFEQDYSRCVAIHELLRDRAVCYNRARGSQPFAGMRDNHFLFRWMLSKLSWTRSRVLNYRPHYSAPSLWQTLLLTLSERYTLIRIRKKVLSVALSSRAGPTSRK